MGSYYVYIHEDPLGSVFYVGKGTGKRAWEKTGRHELWNRYVAHFNGNYNIKIITNNLEEEDAIELEDQKIKEYGGQIVNWVNFNKTGDWSLINRFHKLREENEELFIRAKGLEGDDIEKSIILYKEALDHIKENMAVLELFHESELKYFNGLTKELYKQLNNESITAGNGEASILDRLTLCLKKQGRKSELIDVFNKYIYEYPSIKSYSIFEKIKKRKDEALKSLNTL